MDTLETERLVNNLVERIFRLEEDVAILKRKIEALGEVEAVVPEPATGGKWQLVMVDRGTPLGPQLEAWEVVR